MEGTTIQGTRQPEGLIGNTAIYMIPVDYIYRVHILVYLYTNINTTQHSHESGPKPPIIGKRWY